MTLITAFGVLLFGTEEWQIRLFDLVLSVPVLLLIMLLLPGASFQMINDN